MVNVACQVDMLSMHPAVRDAVASGRVQVAGLFLDIRTARLLVLDSAGEATARFVSVPDDQLPGGLALPNPTDQAPMPGQ
jgi:carbonic anhydrase